ncbi:hypothetical protein MCEZE4_00464 [Burkholderiaceae bacterium]
MESINSYANLTWIDFLDCQALDFLGPTFDIENIIAHSRLSLNIRSSLKTRILNSINYATGLYNLWNYFKFQLNSNQKLFGKVDIWANTRLQEERNTGSPN